MEKVREGRKGGQGKGVYRDESPLTKILNTTLAVSSSSGIRGGPNSFAAF